MERQNNVYIFSPGRLLGTFMRGLRRLWWLVLTLTILVGAGMGAASWMSYSPLYTASATFTVYVKNESQASVTAYNYAAAQQMAKTFPYILTSGVLSDLVREDVGAAALPSISVNTVEDANMIVLSVTGRDPQNCYDVLQSVIKNYPQVAEYVVGPTEMVIVDETGVPAEPVNSQKLGELLQARRAHRLCVGIVRGCGLWLHKDDDHGPRGSSALHQRKISRISPHSGDQKTQQKRPQRHIARQQQPRLSRGLQSHSRPH